MFVCLKSLAAPILVALACAAACFSAPGDEPAAASAGRGVPVEDVVAGVKFFTARVDEALAEKERFAEAEHARIKKDADTLAILSLALGMHTTDHPLKKSAPTMLSASQRLSAGHEKYDAAKVAHGDLETSLAAKSVADLERLPMVKVQWASVADLVILMKQVPFIHNRLTRDVATESKLKKTAANTTAYTATLAAIAQATWYTPPQSAVGKPDRVKKWQEYCDQMRDASGEVNAAIHQGDFEATGSAMQRLNRSCNACHGLFRK